MPETNWAALYGEAEEGAKPVPVGTYDLEITKGEEATTKTGKVMFRYTCKIVSGPYAGKVVYGQQTVSPENPNAMKIFFAHMASMGLDKNFFNGNPSNAMVAGAMIGRRFRADLVMEEWQGVWRNKIDKVHAGTQLPPNAAGVPQIAAGVPQVQPAIAPAVDTPQFQQTVPQPQPAEPTFVPQVAAPAPAQAPIQPIGEQQTVQQTFAPVQQQFTPQQAPIPADQPPVQQMPPQADPATGVKPPF